MPLGSFRRAATAGALSLVLAAGAVAPANAQFDGLDPASLGPEQLEAVLSVAGAVPVGSVVGSADAVGSADVPIGELFPDPPTRPPSQVDPNIKATKFHGVIRNEGRFEYWKIDSAAMQREIIVEVMRSPVADQGPAPVLYLLDGVGAGLNTTGWRSPGDIDDRLAGQHVHTIAPAGAYGSYYSDWEREDPILGNHKWETFLTEELPGIVEEQLRTNGKSAIGGISMGAQAAMHLAATHPELYDAVMSFSGYYSTVDELGYQSVRGAVESRGGNLDNMWGPKGSAKWKYHDTISRAAELKDTRVYFSAGAPVPGESDYAHYGADIQNLFVGLLLESGALEGAKAFERALKRAGVEHRVDYTETGLHNWPNFMQNFEAGWAYIKPALGL